MIHAQTDPYLIMLNNFDSKLTDQIEANKYISEPMFPKHTP